MRFCIGRTVHGAVLEQFTGSWSDLCLLLHDCSNIPQEPLAKLGWWWISPMVLQPGVTQRRIVDVQSLGGWLACDVDTGNLSLTDIRRRAGGCPLIVYSTASATPTEGRWRVLFGLDREYSVEEHARLWRYFAGLYPVDSMTSNVNRISFLPAQWSDTSVFYAEHGRPGCVDDILAMVPPIAPHVPVDFHGLLRKAPDGTPVISATQIDRAMGAAVGGRLYRVMCAAAKRYRLAGWQLSADELAHAGALASGQFSAGKKRGDLRQEAQNALDWAAAHFVPESPMERMRSRLLWEHARKS